MKKIILFLLSIFVVLVIAYAFSLHIPTLYKNENLPASIGNTSPRTDLYTPITMIFFGDGMFGRGVARSVTKNMDDDFSHLFDNLPTIKDYDIAFMNLEGPVSDHGHNVGSKYSFRFEPRVATAIKDAGFDIVNVANNHAGDWTLAAFKDTLSYLDTQGVLYTGGALTKSQAETPTIIDVRGTKIGFLGFTDEGPNWLEAQDNQSGILLASDPRFSEIISNAKQHVDVLVVSFHWGVEYSAHNERQSSLGHTAIDNGADIIIGHHPHVPQDIELYKDKPIVYSLGNFIFDQYFSEETMKGMAVEITLDKEKHASLATYDVPLSKIYQPLGLIEIK